MQLARRAIGSAPECCKCAVEFNFNSTAKDFIRTIGVIGVNPFLGRLVVLFCTVMGGKERKKHLKSTFGGLSGPAEMIITPERKSSRLFCIWMSWKRQNPRSTFTAPSAAGVNVITKPNKGSISNTLPFPHPCLHSWVK